MDEKFIAKEKEYLVATLAALRRKLAAIEDTRGTMAGQLIEQRRRIWENLSDMDEHEQSQEETQAQIQSDHYVMLTKQRNMVENLLYSPYFGKIDFGTAPDQRLNVYIGLAQVDDEKGATYVVDWRAPVADLYYNHDLGDAAYQAPAGTVRGKIYHKYQFKISNGELRYVVDTSTTILDEVLLNELGQNASVQMRNIAATIQREQNAIIRHSHGDNVLVFGVAGSGKTSVALHRIAYILYHCRSAIRADEVLIITPNKAFTRYIGNVLPELGEEMAKQLSVEDIAKEELGVNYNYRTRSWHLEHVYAAPPSEEEVASMRYKASVRFAEDIERFAARADDVCFRARDFVAGSAYRCDKQVFQTLYHVRFANYPSVVRMNKIADYVLREMADTYHSKLSQELQGKVRRMIYSMYHRYDVVTLYRMMLTDLRDKEGAPVRVFARDDIIPYEDVFGVILLKCYVEGARLKGSRIKHLVIDEMQDYTPVQYAYFNRLFACPKTVLGDVNQMADPFLNVGDEATARAMLGGEACVTFHMDTSYRSTYEIARYANRFTDSAITPMDRHGEEPLVMACTPETHLAVLKRQIDVARDKRYMSVAVIARSAEEARALQRRLAPLGALLLLDADTPYTGGIVVTTPFAAKGFEFDQVIVADACDRLYGKVWDDRLLYIATTRALHRLVVLYTEAPSRYLRVDAEQNNEK